MHLVARGQLLAQEADGHLCDRQGVLRIDPFPGRGRCVGLASAEVDVVVGHGEAGGRQALGRPGVHHHGGVDAGEGAAFEHEDLAAAALLGGGAEHADGEPELVGHGGQGQPGPDRGGGDDVVTAGVADVGQGVVFGAHGHDELAVTSPGLERRRQVVDAFVHWSPPARRASATARAEVVSPKQSSGVAVDRMAQRDELVEVSVDGRGRGFLGR